MRKFIYGALAVLLVLFLTVTFLPPLKAKAADNTWFPGWRQNTENGWTPGIGRGSMMQGGPAMRGAGFMPSQIADILGMDWATLRSKLAEGKSYGDIVREKGMTVEDVKAKLLAKHQEYLDQLVKDKKITGEQAQDMQKFMSERVQVMLENKFVPGQGFGGRRGFGGCGGCWGGSTGTAPQGFTGARL
jgi:hypothetical protein